MNRRSRRAFGAVVLGGASLLLVPSGASAAAPAGGHNGEAAASSRAGIGHGASLSSGGTFTSVALVPTGDTSVDVAGPADSITGALTGATTVPVTGAARVAGSAIGPEGRSALVATSGGNLERIADPLSANPTTSSLDLSQFDAEGASFYTAQAEGVAIAPDGTAGLATVESEGAVALTRASGTWQVDTSVQSPGLNQASPTPQPHQPGWIEVPSAMTAASNFNGVVISSTKAADGHYLGLLMDAFGSTVAVVTGVGTSGAKVSGTLTDATQFQDNGVVGYGGLGDYGNGGMAFSPTTATKAAVVTLNGFGVLDLSDPGSPSLGSLTTVPAAAGNNGAQSVAVAPDGNHVAVAVGGSLYFYTGLRSSTAGAPLTLAAGPVTVPGVVTSLDYTASGNLIVNYSNTAVTEGYLAVVTDGQTTAPVLHAALTLSGPVDVANGASVLPEAGALDTGYLQVASDGGLFAFGQAGFHGSMGGQPLNKPIVGVASTPDDQGYWEVASDGGIFSFGDAAFHGSTGSLTLNKPIVGMAATPDGQGYWLVASDGGIFAYGDAAFFGSTGSLTLNKPIVGMAATPDGGGYWLVASDGGIFSYGDAAFFGSTGSLTLNKPVVGMASTPDGGGYWLVASDGGIFAYGDATFFGSMGGSPLNKPVVGIATSDTGQGYWEVASDGGIFSFGDSLFFGSMGGQPLNQPIVGMTATVG
jgi:hypothetical protein